jgi:hypothetical protein
MSLKLKYYYGLTFLFVIPKGIVSQNTIPQPINQRITIDKPVKHVYSSGRSESYFYKTDIYYNRNKQVIRENKKFYMIEYYDSNHVKSKTQLSLGISKEIIGFGDSMPLESFKRAGLLNQDSTYDPTRIVTDILLSYHGKHVSYNANGWIECRGKYRHHSKYGRWKYYDSNNRVIKRERFGKNRTI